MLARKPNGPASQGGLFKAERNASSRKLYSERVAPFVSSVGIAYLIHLLTGLEDTFRYKAVPLYVWQATLSPSSQSLPSVDNRDRLKSFAFYTAFPPEPPTWQKQSTLRCLASEHLCYLVFNTNPSSFIHICDIHCVFYSHAVTQAPDAPLSTSTYSKNVQRHLCEKE